MRPDGGDRPFGELPAALVEELLGLADDIGDAMLSEFESNRQQRSEWRQQILGRDLLIHESDLPNVPIPTTCGVDGSYAIERLLGIDLVTAGAVSVEGLTPPSETRHWPQPQHRALIQREPHCTDTSLILRAIMIGEELLLAACAPHSVVLIDGSITTPLIFLNQAFNMVNRSSQLAVTTILCERASSYLQAYEQILASERSDRCWIAAPKYTTRREFGEAMAWPQTHDDKAMLTLLMEPGELTIPVGIAQPDEPWHLNTESIPSACRQTATQAAERATSLLNDLKVVYYRPHRWIPALRLEMGSAVAQTPGRLAAVISALKHQCRTASMMEPYPLFMADRMVKHLSRALPTLRHVATQSVARNYDGDIGEVYMNLHGYRTESGG